MHKEDILKKNQKTMNKEYDFFLDQKTLPILMTVFIILCFAMMLFSFITPFQQEIFYTSTTLLLTFLASYFLAYFYYLRISKYLYIGLFFLVFLMFSISYLWLLIWQVKHMDKNKILDLYFIEINISLRYCVKLHYRHIRSRYIIRPVRSIVRRSDVA